MSTAPTRSIITTMSPSLRLSRNLSPTTEHIMAITTRPIPPTTQVETTNRASKKVSICIFSISIIPRLAAHSARPVVQNTNTSAQPPNQTLNPRFPDPPSARAEAADFRAEPPEHAPDSGDAEGRDGDIKKTKNVPGCPHSMKKVGFFHTIGLFMVVRYEERKMVREVRDVTLLVLRKVELNNTLM